MPRALIIFGHTERDSLCGALASAYAKGFSAAAGAVERIDLASLSFDPIFREKDQPMEPDLLAAQQAIVAADHLVFVFPTYWAMPPALVKGFIDRTFLPGYAYQHEGRSLPRGLLAGRSARVVTTMDSPWYWYRFAHARGMHAALHIATLSYVGIAPRAESTVFRVRDKSRAELAREIEALETTASADARALASRARTSRRLAEHVDKSVVNDRV